MASLTNITKNTASLSNRSRNAATTTNIAKSLMMFGDANFDQVGHLTFEGTIDGRTVGDLTFESLITVRVTNQTKS